MEWFQLPVKCRYVIDGAECGREFVGTRTGKYCPTHAVEARKKKQQDYVRRQNQRRKVARRLREVVGAGTHGEGAAA